MSYASAKNFCKSLDRRSHLAEIMNQEIQKVIEGVKDFDSHYNWWLGGSDRSKV